MQTEVAEDVEAIVWDGSDHCGHAGLQRGRDHWERCFVVFTSC